jgi:5-methyltetrahydropteroyltriglutamate--homocysteine methyltransferase
MAAIYRTEHVGSMVRPARLLDARDAFEAGKITRDDLTKVEDECILEALALQKDAGIGVFTDGELRRTSYTTDQYDAVEGFAEKYPVVENTKPDGTKVMVEMHTKPVVGKLRQVRRLAKHEADFLRQHTPGPWKITMPTPIRFRPKDPPPAPYRDWDEVQRDVVDIFKGEMVNLAKEGVPYLQFDRVPTQYLTPESRARMQADGIDPEKQWLDELALENECYDAARAANPNVMLAMHYCRGNRVGFTGGAGGYDLIAESGFNQLHVDRFLLEFDTARAGGFEPLRHVPKGKTVMLGLVTTKSDVVEQKDDLLRRIDEASKFISIDQLALGPQCGFQSAANRDGASMGIDAEKRKMELIAEVARQVWKQ